MGTNIYQKGDRGTKVREIQEMLDKAGYSLAIDGIYGKETASKVTDFQKQHHLQVDGMAGPETIDCLEKVSGQSPSNASNQPLLQKGDEGEAVKQVQAKLQKSGFELSVDGIYGSETESAVKAFQESAGISIDGITGPNTWQAFNDTPSSGQKPAIDPQTFALDQGHFIKETYAKKTIVLHHTNGHTIDDHGHDVMNHVQHWKDLNNRVGAAFSITYSGRIYQHFDPSYWIYHLGIEGHERDAEAIAIELCNEGPLQKEVDGTFTWFNGQVRYKRPNDTPVHQPWRNEEYWAPYSDAQLESLISLIRHLLKAFDIPGNLIDHNEYEEALFTGNFQGIYTHANVRKDKTDVSPAFDYSRLKNALHLNSGNRMA